MNELLESAAARASRYLARSRSARSRRRPRPSPGLDVLREPFPDGPSEPAEVLALLDEVGSPATMAIAGPRFFGFVIGGALPVALAANWLATAWDQNAAFDSRHARRLAARGGRARVDARALRLARGLRGRVRHRRHDGQLQRARRGAARGAAQARTGTSRPTASSARPRSPS